MEHSLKINKRIQYISMMVLIMVLVLAFVFTSVVAASPAQAKKSVSQTAISNYLAAQANSSLSDTQKIKAAINAYFTTRYEGQKTLQAQDFSQVLSDAAQPWVKKEIDKREIERYVAKLFDLSHLSYQFTLNYHAIRIHGIQATVQLYEGTKSSSRRLRRKPHRWRIWRIPLCCIINRAFGSLIKMPIKMNILNWLHPRQKPTS